MVFRPPSLNCQTRMRRYLVIILLGWVSFLLTEIQANLIITVGQTSNIVSQRNTITTTISTSQTISKSLKLTIDSDFTLVLDDGTPGDDKTSPCYIGGFSAKCVVSEEGQNHALIFSSSIFNANTNYDIGILVVNPPYADNFRLDGYQDNSQFQTFGTIAINPETISCSIIMSSQVVRAKADATFNLNVGTSPPAGSSLFISSSIPNNNYGFPKVIASNPICTGTTQSNPPQYTCSLSQVFSQQILTIKNLFPTSGSSISFKVSSLFNPPYNASWVSLRVRINDNVGRQMRMCDVYQSAPIILPDSKNYLQSGWNEITDQTSSVQHTLTTFFTPLPSATLLMIFNSALVVSTNPPASSSSTAFNTTFTALKISNPTLSSTTIQVSTTFKNPASAIPLGLQFYVLFNSTNFMEKYLYPAANMVLQIIQHSVSLTLSNNKTGFNNLLNVSMNLGIQGTLSRVGQAIIAKIIFQKGQINCGINLNIQTNIPAFMVLSCSALSINVASSTSISLNSIWVSFSYRNHFSQAPNLVTTQLNTINDYAVSQGTLILSLQTYTCDFSLTNTVTKLGAQNIIQVRQNYINTLTLTASHRIITLNPPKNLQPLSLGITILNESVLTSIVSYNILNNMIQVQFIDSGNMSIGAIANPGDYTLPGRTWSISITDVQNNPSASCSVISLPQYTPVTATINYLLSNKTIQQNSTLSLLIDSILRYTDNSLVVPVVIIQLNPAIVLDVNSSVCGVPGFNTRCIKVASSVVNSSFGGLQTNITLSIKNSPQPIGNNIIIKVIHPITGFIFQTANISYNLIPLQFGYTVNFTGFYLSPGQLQINITSKPNRSVSLIYVESDVQAIMNSPQCTVCGQGDRIIINGTVKYFFSSDVKVRGVGSNGVIYAQSTIQVKYPCPWIGCRICERQKVFNSTTNLTQSNQLVCLKCFDQQLTKYNFLYNSQCYQNCPISTYPSIVKCEPCQSLCYSCTNLTCTECNPGYFVYRSTCVQDCPPTYIKNSTHCLQREIVCPNHCIQCPQDNQCNRCDTGYYLLNNLCYGQCPSGFVIDPENQTVPSCTLFIPPEEAGFFPFIFVIIVVIWFIILAVFKCFEKRSLMLGNFVALCSILEWGPLIMVIVMVLTKHDPLSQTNTAQLTLLSEALVFITLFTKILINLIFFIYFIKKISDDSNFLAWKQRSIAHRNIYYVILILSLSFSFQNLRVIYSRLFGLQIFYGRFNTVLIFKPINFFTLGYFLIPSICIYVLAAVAIYNEGGYHTTLYYSAIQLIILQALLMLAAAIDAKCGKSDQFFDYQVYKVENLKDQVVQEMGHGRKKPIDIQYQNESGGSLHQILHSSTRRNYRQDAGNNQQWIKTNRISKGLTLQEEQSGQKIQSQGEQDQQLPAGTRSHLFRWKILKDWNNIKQSMPQSYNPSMLRTHNQQHKSKSPDNVLSKRSPNHSLKSIKRISSAQDLNTAKVINPLGMVLSKDAIKALRKNYDVLNINKKYYYNIDENANRLEHQQYDQNAKRPEYQHNLQKQMSSIQDDESEQCTDVVRNYSPKYTSDDRFVGCIVKSQLKEGKNRQNINDIQEKLSEIKNKNIFPDVQNQSQEGDQAISALQKGMSLADFPTKGYTNHRYSKDAELDADSSDLQQIEDGGISILPPSFDSNSKQDNFEQIFESRRKRKMREPQRRNINRRTQEVYLQRLMNSQGMESKKRRNLAPNKNRQDF